MDEKPKRNHNQPTVALSTVVLLLFTFVVMAWIVSNTSRSSRVVVRATPTPSPAQAMKSNIHRKTDVTVFNISIKGSSAVIRYDLIPQIFQPNEWIHDRQIYKMICALKRVKHTVTFVGEGRFKNEYGKRINKPSVETQLTAGTMNRIDCSVDTSAHDINWGKISEYYKSYPIPRGLNVDH